MQPIEFEVNVKVNPQLMGIIDKDKDLKLLLNSFTQVLQGIASNISNVGDKAHVVSSLPYREAITEMGLSKRSQHALLQSGLAYVDQLKEHTLEELLAIKGVGNNAIAIIQDKVELLSEKVEQQSEYSKIGFPTRLENLLKKMGYNTPEELKNESPERIKAIEGLGKISKTKILDFLGIKDLPDSRNRVSVSRLGFDTKVINALVNAGINTERQLVASDPAKLRKLKGIGPQSHILLKDYIQDAKVEIKGLDVRDLGFSSRARTILSKNGVYSLEQLKNMTFTQIQNMNGVGQGIMHEIINVLEHGIANPEKKESTPVKAKTKVLDTPTKTEETKEDTKPVITEEPVKDKKVEPVETKTVETPKVQVDSTPVKKHNLNILELPVRIINLIQRTSRIKSVEDLIACSDKEILSLRGITAKSLTFIHEAIEKYNKLTSEEKANHAHYFLKDIGLEKRICDILVNNKFIYVDQLIGKTDSELLSIKGVGKPTMIELKETIAKFI